MSDLRIAAVVLAGGRSRRMGGGEKFLLELAGKPLIGRVLDRLGPQVEQVAISANCDPALLAGCGAPVIADAQPSRGPLSGLLSGLRWADRVPGCTHLVSVPADTPFIPPDLVSRLRGGSAGGPDTVAIAGSAGRRHPVIGLWPVSALEALSGFLDLDRDPSIMQFLAGLDWAIVEFPFEDGLDPFFNVNTPDDLEEARRRAAHP